MGIQPRKPLILRITSKAGRETHGVDNYAEASRLTREHLDKHDLGSSQFSRAVISRRRQEVATVSYNGRVWDPQGALLFDTRPPQAETA